eukprot:CAMPEP_0197632746 /NCGR_PEP_ID=MMETSP1338-20131121/9347_1 /TAXON_ID=43686 ORGANISM="Pelagodinium beii, Strain RCC1491" /NCGR_SAMPLE_ID=MMETSP1338 /ASSEMBLY_ACC=CAM_ASM_000754 /LENGTH=124 /DNA_ID=CAMNT_0043204317 /DNA_START=205 /DNA_END=580 /DNA_ORIENTATION=+
MPPAVVAEAAPTGLSIAILEPVWIAAFSGIAVPPAGAFWSAALSNLKLSICGASKVVAHVAIAFQVDHKARGTSCIEGTYKCGICSSGITACCRNGFSKVPDLEQATRGQVVVVWESDEGGLCI